MVALDKFAKFFGKDTFFQQINDFIVNKSYMEITLKNHQIKKMNHYE